MIPCSVASLTSTHLIVCFSSLFLFLFFLVCLSVSRLQLLSEKISGTEGTKPDEDFTEMERVSLNAFLPFITNLVLFISTRGQPCHKLTSFGAEGSVSHAEIDKCASFMIFFFPSPYLCLIVLVFFLFIFF